MEELDNKKAPNLLSNTKQALIETNSSFTVEKIKKNRKKRKEMVFYQSILSAHAWLLTSWIQQKENLKTENEEIEIKQKKLKKKIGKGYEKK